jgi:Uma2 family endonuclease
MPQAKLKFANFEEYMAWSSDPDRYSDYDSDNDSDNAMEGQYELLDGELVQLPTESGLNDLIANYIFLKLVAIGVPFPLVRPGKCEVQVPVLQPGDAANRIPDLVVLREAHLALIQNRLTITLDMPPPVMVVEVVSPEKKQRDRDYIHKLAQYEAIAIPTYWIVDPQQQKITVFQLEPLGYQNLGEFRDQDIVICPSFPSLTLTANQILNVG